MREINEEDYVELMKIKSEHSAAAENILNVLDKLRKEYDGFVELRDELKEKSIGIKIINDVIVKNYTTQLLVEDILKTPIEVTHDEMMETLA